MQLKSINQSINVCIQSRKDQSIFDISRIICMTLMKFSNQSEGIFQQISKHSLSCWVTQSVIGPHWVTLFDLCFHSEYASSFSCHVNIHETLRMIKLLRMTQSVQKRFWLQHFKCNLELVENYVNSGSFSISRTEKNVRNIQTAKEIDDWLRQFARKSRDSTFFNLFFFAKHHITQDF